MPKVLTGFYAVCKGRATGVFTTWEEAQSYVQGYPGAKFKKFKTEVEAEQWFRTNIPPGSTTSQTTTATPRTPTTLAPRITSTSLSNTVATYVQPKPAPTSAPKPVAQPAPRTVTTPATGPAQLLRIAAPKNTTVDIVYSDGACRGNGRPNPVAGIGVWWGPDDPRNLSERCPGDQTNNRAELVAIARVLETVPLSANTLIIRTDSTYSKQALTVWCLKWRKNGWKGSSGKPVLNKELIEYILTLLDARQWSGQQVQLEYVKGHSGDVGNDGADALAVAGCSLPTMPEKDWVGLKVAYCTEKNMTVDLGDLDPADFLLSDEDLMKELEGTH